MRALWFLMVLTRPAVCDPPGTLAHVVRLEAATAGEDRLRVMLMRKPAVLRALPGFIANIGKRKSPKALDARAQHATSWQQLDDGLSGPRRAVMRVHIWVCGGGGGSLALAPTGRARLKGCGTAAGRAHA